MTTAADMRYISPTEAAKALGMSTSSVYRAVANGHPRERVGAEERPM
jgi:predicted DNA-binding transcriptional regulator AlpA